MSRTAVVGLGLIGGSIALGARARGFDADAAVRDRARRRGLDVADRLPDALEGAELVVLAAPTAAIPALLAEAAVIAPGAVLTDCASLKRPVVEAAARLPERSRCVGGHPMAGGRAPGIDGADPELFRGRPWAVVPTARSDEAALARVERLAASLGARALRLDAERHDRAMTWVSHLPLAASAALALATSRGAGADLAPLAGPGISDATRLAATPETLAMELALADPAALAAAIEALSSALSALASALRRGDAEALRALLREAGAARRLLEG
jgi:prephenate dehydrogenase